MSFHRKDGGPDGDGRNFHDESRTNDTHASTTGPDAKLYRKGHGHEARLAYPGHLVIENGHGLIVDAMASTADGRAERELATVLLHDHVQRRGWRSRTVGADKGFDTRESVGDARGLWFTPHVAQNTARPAGSAIDDRTTRHASYATIARGRASSRRLDRCPVAFVPFCSTRRLVPTVRRDRHRIPPTLLSPCSLRGICKPSTALPGSLCDSCSRTRS